MDVAGGEPAPDSIPLALPPSSGQSLDHSDNLPGLETQSLLVLLAAERIQSFVVGSGHGGKLWGAADSSRHTSRQRTKLLNEWRKCLVVVCCALRSWVGDKVAGTGAASLCCISCCSSALCPTVRRTLAVLLPISLPPLSPKGGHCCVKLQVTSTAETNTKGLQNKRRS